MVWHSRPALRPAQRTDHDLWAGLLPPPNARSSSSFPYSSPDHHQERALNQDTACNIVRTTGLTRRHHGVGLLIAVIKQGCRNDPEQYHTRREPGLGGTPDLSQLTGQRKLVAQTSPRVTGLRWRKCSRQGVSNRIVSQCPKPRPNARETCKQKIHTLPGCPSIVVRARRTQK